MVVVVVVSYDRETHDATGGTLPLTLCFVAPRQSGLTSFPEGFSDSLGSMSGSSQSPSPIVSKYSRLPILDPRIPCPSMTKANGE